MQSNTELSNSALLMKFIGIPTLCDPDFSQLTDDNFGHFLKVAEKNKVNLLFLRTVASKLDDFPAKSTFLCYEEKYKKTIDLTKFVAALLGNIGVQYTFFKTIKPFPYLPSDVDVLFFSNDVLKTVVGALTDHGCIALDGDLYGVTMYCPTYDLNIDLTTQIAVTGLTYVDKYSLLDHVIDLEFYGTLIRTLDPPADVLVVAAHSVFKEQMFTLSDYYFLVMSMQHWTEASKLAKKLHLSSAFKTILKMTGAVTLSCFGSMNLLINQLKAIEIMHIINKPEPIELPTKYDLVTIIAEFLKKLSDQSLVNSLPCAVKSFINPDFYHKALMHATRKKY